MIPRKLIPGEPFDVSATSHGGFVDVLSELRAQQMRSSREPEYSHVYPGGTMLDVSNESDQVVPWYGILELSNPLFIVDDALDVTSFQQKVVFTGQAPYRMGIGEYGIAQLPINKNTVGPVLIEGVTQARVYYANTHALGFDYASPIMGNVEVLAARAGGIFKILWSEKLLGVSWALVRLETPRTIGFELAEDHPGRGEIFKIFIGEFHNEDHRWSYDCSSVHLTIPGDGNTGSGTVNFTGDYTDISPYGYRVEIVEDGWFKWSDDGGMEWSVSVGITGGAQDLNNGVKVTFSGTSNWTIGDSWGTDAWIIRCIDWRYGTPQPDKGTTGLGIWRHSDTYKSIIEVVSLDCDVPDDGPICT